MAYDPKNYVAYRDPASTEYNMYRNLVASELNAKINPATDPVGWNKAADALIKDRFGWDVGTYQKERETYIQAHPGMEKTIKSANPKLSDDEVRVQLYKDVATQLAATKGRDMFQLREDLIVQYRAKLSKDLGITDPELINPMADSFATNSAIQLIKNADTTKDGRISDAEYQAALPNLKNGPVLPVTDESLITYLDPIEKKTQEYRRLVSAEVSVSIDGNKDPVGWANAADRLVRERYGFDATKARAERDTYISNNPDMVAQAKAGAGASNVAQTIAVFNAAEAGLDQYRGKDLLDIRKEQIAHFTKNLSDSTGVTGDSPAERDRVIKDAVELRALAAAQAIVKAGDPDHDGRVNPAFIPAPTSTPAPTVTPSTPPTASPTPTVTATPVPTQTPTVTPTSPTTGPATPTPTGQATPTPTNAPVPTNTPTPIPNDYVVRDGITYDNNLTREKVNAAMIKAGYNRDGADLATGNIFRKFDANGDGKLTADEQINGMNLLVGTGTRNVQGGAAAFMAGVNADKVRGADDLLSAITLNDKALAAALSNLRGAVTPTVTPQPTPNPTPNDAPGATTYTYINGVRVAATDMTVDQVSKQMMQERGMIKPVADAAAQWIFQNADTNKDGKLTGAEAIAYANKFGQPEESGTVLGNIFRGGAKKTNYDKQNTEYLATSDGKLTSTDLFQMMGDVDPKMSQTIQLLDPMKESMTSVAPTGPLPFLQRSVTANDHLTKEQIISTLTKTGMSTNEAGSVATTMIKGLDSNNDGYLSADEQVNPVKKSADNNGIFSPSSLLGPAALLNNAIGNPLSLQASSFISPAALIYNAISTPLDSSPKTIARKALEDKAISTEEMVAYWASSDPDGMKNATSPAGIAEFTKKDQQMISPTTTPGSRGGGGGVQLSTSSITNLDGGTANNLATSLNSVSFAQVSETLSALFGGKLNVTNGSLNEINTVASNQVVDKSGKGNGIA